jgi:hypothetical protein
MFSASITQMVPMKANKARAQVAMPPCTAKFALACCDPFDPKAKGVCYPVGGMASQKVHVFNRLDFVAGTGGVGWVILTPSLANNAINAFYTTSGYAGTVMSPLSANNVLNTGVLTAVHNGPYTVSNLTPASTAQQNVEGRIVAVGARFQNTGTLLNRSGVRYCFVEPSHNSVSGMGAADLGLQGLCEISAVDEKPCMITAFPINTSEESYSNTDTLGVNTTATMYPFSNGFSNLATTYGGSTFSYSTTGILAGIPIMALFVSGATSGNSFHVELIQHMEFVGQLAGPVSTKSDADVEGAKKVVTAASTIVERKQAEPNSARGPWSFMYEGLQEVWAEAKPVVIPAVVSALAAIL